MAKAFYVEWLGFTVDWEHQFGPDFPKYLQISRESIVLHLSEHYGDCSPGAKIVIYLTDIEALHADLSSRPNRYARPSVELAEWGAKTMQITDPFGNRLLFNQNI